MFFVPHPVLKQTSEAKGLKAMPLTVWRANGQKMIGAATWIQWHGRDVRDTEVEFAKSCSFVVLLLRTISSFYLIEDAPLILEFGKIQVLYGFVALLFTEWSQNRLNLTAAAILPPCMLHLAFASFGPCVPAICSSSKHISSSSAHFTRL